MSKKLTTKVEYLEKALAALYRQEANLKEEMQRHHHHIDSICEALAKARKDEQTKAAKPPSWSALPSINYQVKCVGGDRGHLYFKKQEILSTISPMHATVDAWIHFVTGSLSNGDHITINWRERPKGFRFWYYNDAGVCSRDFTSIEAAVRAAHKANGPKKSTKPTSF